MRVISYLKPYVGIIALVVALLVAQVFCELSIPRYTSLIVDVGIQQYGVADGALDRVRRSTLERLIGASDAPDAALLRGAYVEDADHPDVLVPRGTYASGDGRAELAGALRPAEAALYARDHGSPAAGEGDQVGDLLDQQVIAFAVDEYRELDDAGYLLDRQMGYLISTGGIMLLACLASALIAVLIGLNASRLGARFSQDLRADLMADVLSFSREGMQELSAASLITRITNDVTQVQTVITMSLRMIAFAPVMALGAGIMVARTAPSMAWIVGVALACVLGVIAMLLVLTLPRFRMLQKLIDRVNLIAREHLNGVDVIRAFNREEYESARFDEANGDLLATVTFTNRAMASMMPAMLLIMNLATIAIMWFGSFQVEVGSVQVGDLIAFVNYAMHLCMSFMMLAMIAVLVPRAQVSVERLDEVLSTVPGITDAATCELPAGWVPRGRIEFDHVSLRFADAERDVLHDVCFTAEPASVTAIVGSTGSGKSTLVRMIERFYDPTEGSVRLDGIDLRDLPQAQVRKVMGYVPQQSFLFSGTVRSNIAYADQDMPFDEVRHAADVAQATGFIEAMEGGFDAPISQGGANVSGGQRQRLGIARAIAAKPKVLIFDDSFSALDLATESLVREGLRRELASSTVIIVAQRISTVVGADRIVVLDDGAVVGCGSHDELLATCPVYASIAHSQLSDSELGRISGHAGAGGTRGSLPNGGDRDE